MRPRDSRLTFGLVILAACAFSATVAYLNLPAPATPTITPPVQTVPEPPATTPAESPPPPAEAESPAGNPVRFANPFDATEVFEFPPGTSQTDARKAVADALLERARERLNPPSGAQESPKQSQDADDDDSRLARRN